MESVDPEVLKRSTEWLDAGRRVLLVTVVKTWGNSPRPEGAMLAKRSILDEIRVSEQPGMPRALT
jgi:xanthine dehydrogenase accessory factor